MSEAVCRRRLSVVSPPNPLSEARIARIARIKTRPFAFARRAVLVTTAIYFGVFPCENLSSTHLRLP